MKKYEFDAIVIKVDGLDATYIEFPYSVEEEFGVKGQVKVKATFDDVEYRGSLAKMGHHCHRLGITKDIRNKINKQAGDSVHVIIEKDDAPRVVDVPLDLIEQFNINDTAKNFFNTLSYSNQKKYVEWIEGAKRQETRAKRVNEAITKLSNSVKL